MKKFLAVILVLIPCVALGFFFSPGGSGGGGGTFSGTEIPWDNVTGKPTSLVADGYVSSTKITDNTIVNADINSAAGIVGSKLADATIDMAKIRFNHDLGYSKYTGATQIRLRYYFTNDTGLGYLTLRDNGMASITGTDNAGTWEGSLTLGIADGSPAAYLRANTGFEVKVEGDNVVITGQLQSDNVAITGGSVTGITDVTVADGGTGRSTGTTAYALIATGTTATGAQQTLASGATTEVLVGGGASALPVWTTATGTGAPVRAGSPTFTGTVGAAAITATGAVTASEFVSSALDNTRGATIPNTADPTTTNLALGKGWFNTTSNMVKWRNGDNTATLEVMTSGASHTLNFATTGTLTGGIMILDNVASPTAAQTYGSLNIVNAAITVTLPAAASGMSMCVLSTAAAAVNVDVDGSDVIYLNGTALDAGDKVTSASAAGDFICLVSSGAVNWYTLGRSGTWTDGGP